MRRNHLTASIAILLAVIAAAPSAIAQTWPTRPVRVIVSFPAGGGTDATARAYAEKLSQILGQQFVVDNRAGASGVISHDVCAKAAPDGYTLCVATLGGIGLLPQVRKTPYDPVKDFTPIGRVTDALFGFAVHPSSPWTTMQEFADDARKKPDTFTLANSGVATITHLAGETMAASFGIRLVMVPYKGGVEQLQDALAGHVSMMYEGNFFPHVKAGKAKLLAVTGQRHPDYPDVPSFAETYPAADFVGWNALFAPVGTPDAIVRKMNAAFDTISKTPEVAALLFKVGQFPHGGTPEDLMAIMRSDFERYGKLTRELNIKPE